MPPETDNLRLQELFEADQKDRARIYERPEHMQGLRERDTARTGQVYAMMEREEVRTKNDLYNAALILHHGADPGDFLASHRLACMAAVMGHRTARWLSAASLDRYLMSLSLPQVYGTQFEYNAALRCYQLRLPIQDGRLLQFEKEFLGVPPIAERLEGLNRQLRGRTVPGGNP